MGRQQIYKGDPGTKQYYLVNDFTGGINNTSVDERTQDNEFRELLNVELSTKGMLQNRKGWGNSKLLNELIAEANITLPTSNVALLKTVKNEGSLLQKLNDAEERGLLLFDAKQTLGNYSLEVLFIYDQAGVKLGLLTLTNTGASFTVIATVSAGSISNDRTLTSIETVDYSDFIYFNLSSLNPSFVGIGEYNIAQKTYRTIANQNVYQPNAYEVSKIGFNVLSNDPLNAIRETTGSFNISGMYLTTQKVEAGAIVDTKTPIFLIPPDGKVTLNVIYVGTNVELSNFNVDFYTTTLDDEGLPVETKLNSILEASQLVNGLAKFAYTIQLQNKPEINIRVTLSTGITLAMAKAQVKTENSFASTTAMMDYFLEPEDRLIVSPDTVNTDRMFLHRKFTTTPYLYNEISSLSLFVNGQSFTVSKSGNIGLVYDGSKLITNTKWAEATESDFTAQTNPALKNDIALNTLNPALAEADCEDFDDLNINTIRDPESDYYLAPTYPVNYVLKVRRTHVVEQTDPVGTFTVSDATAYNAFSGNKTTIGTSTAPLSGFNSGSNATAFNNLTATQFRQWLIDNSYTLPTVDTHYGIHGYYTTTGTTTYYWAPYSGSGSATLSYFASTNDTTCSILANANPDSFATASASNVGTIMELKSYYPSSTTVTYDIVGAQSYAGTETWVSSNPSGCAYFPIGGGSTLTSWAQSNINANNYSDGQIIRVLAVYYDGIDLNPCGITYYLRINKTINYTNCTTRKFISTSSGGGTTSTYIGIKYFKVNFGPVNQIVDCDPLAFPNQPMAKYYKIVNESIGYSTGALVYDTTSGDTGFLYYMINGVKIRLYYYPSIALLSTQETSATPQDVKRVASMSIKRPNPAVIYYAGDNPDTQTNYYRYKEGSTLGTLIGDFTYVQFSDVVDENNYVDIYSVGITQVLKEVEPLVLSGFRMLEIGSRLVLYKDNIIWFSDLYQFDYIPNYNYIILPLTPDDVITSINYFKGSYMVFTKQRIYKMSGTFGLQDFQVQIVSDAIGCIAPYSVRAFNNTVAFMSKDGLYRLKQNYYLGGLENVEKIDKQITGTQVTNAELYSILYKEQYMLFYKYEPGRFVTAPFNVVKMYYNLDAPQGNPFVTDKTAIEPLIITKFDEALFSLRNGKFYQYDKGYTDFLTTSNPTDEQKENSKYIVRMKTPNLFFFYPTHDKKMKAIIVKTNCQYVVPLYFNIYVDGRIVSTYQSYALNRQPDGQLLYELVETPTLTVGNVGRLDDYNLTIDKLGDISTQVHKINFAGKGKTIQVEIYQKLDDYFGIQDIGYIYKMGKAREDR